MKSKINLNKLTGEVSGLVKNLDNISVDFNRLPDEIQKCIKSVDPNTLDHLKNSIDRQGVVNEAVGMLESLKNSFSSQEKNALGELIEAVVKEVKKQ